MTTTPSIETEPSTMRMASTAAWSAASLLPIPTSRAAGSAAASVTRTSSRARLRSGRSSGVGMAREPRWARLHHARRLALALGGPGARGGTDEHEHRPEDGDEVAPVQRHEAADGAGAVDDAVVEEQAEGGDRDDRGHLTARPREGDVAGDDVGEDERRRGRGEQQPAQDRVRIPTGEVAARAVDAPQALRRVPRQEQADAEQQPSAHRDV